MTYLRLQLQSRWAQLELCHTPHTKKVDKQLITCAKQSLGRRLTTGLSSPRSESRSASAIAYAGTGSRFFTRILAVFLTGVRIRHWGTCSHVHTRTDIQTSSGADKYERRRCSHGMVWRAIPPEPLPKLGPAFKASTSQRIKPRDIKLIFV